MSVYLDVSTRLDRRAAEAAMAEARNMWRNTGDDIGKGLSGSINRALGAIDGSAARRTISELRNEHQLLARDAAEAHRLMERGLGDVETRTRRLSEVTAKYGADSSQASAATVALADAHAIAARNTRDHELAAANAAAAHGKLDAAASKTATSIGAMGALANGVGVASLVGLGATMAATTHKAADFEQGMIKLHAAAGETAENLKTVSDGILKVSTQTGTSAGELQNAMYLIEKAGYRGADGIKVLSAAAQGANAEQADLAEVVSGLTTSMVDFHIAPEKSAELMSKMVTAVGEAKTSFQEFAGALHSVEPAAAMAHLKLEDVWGTLAQITQSGTSPAQAAQNMNQAITSLARPNSVQAQKMQQLGISPDDISQNLSTRGLAGTLQTLYADIGKRVDPSTGKVDVGELTHNAGGLQNLHDMLNMSGEGAMSDGAKQMSEAYLKGEMGARAYTMAIRKANDEDSKKMEQFKKLTDSVNSFSSRLAGGRDTLETMNAALGDVTGTTEAASVAMQVTGENAQATNDKIKNIATTFTEADGSVKGFNESQDGLNAKMRDVKAGFSAVAIELGSAFVPILKDVANVLKFVSDEMAEHPGLAKAAAVGMTVLSGAWVAWKIATSDAVKAAMSGLGTVMEKLGLTTAAAMKTNTALAEAGPSAMRGAAGVQTAAQAEIAEEDAVAEAAGRADGALAAGGGMRGGMGRFLGPAAAVTLGSDAADSTIDKIDTAHPGLAPFLKPLQMMPNGITAWHYGKQAWDWLTKPEGHAGGGAVGGSGPKGKDSVPAWLAPGEHVLTSADVDAAGGHAGVYAWRNALHREMGGPSDIDAAILSNVPAGRYSQTGAADLTKGLADCSSAVEDLVNIIDGNSTAGRSMSTGNEAQWLTAHGFLPGMGGPGDFRVGFDSSHTQATLPGGTPFNWGSDAAAARGGVGGTGAYDPAFTSHFYRPMGAGGGLGGFYSPDPEKVAKVEQQIDRKNDQIHDLEERLSEMKSTAKQSERDHLQHEIEHAKEDLKNLQGKLAEAQRGTFHSGGRGGSRGGGGGGMQFGAPLPENFGLGKGIPGFFEWLTTFLADMAIGPIEGAMLGNFMRSGGDMSDFGGLGGGAAGGFGDIAAAAGVPLTSLDPSLGGNYTPPAAGGSGSGGGGGAGGSKGSWWAPGSGKSGSSGLWWAPGSKPVGSLTDMAGKTPAGPFSYKNPDGSYPAGFVGPQLIDPARSLSEGAIAGIHGDSMTPGPLAYPPNHVPEGHVDWDAIRRGPLGSLDGMTNRPPPMRQTHDLQGNLHPSVDYKAWYGAPQFATGGPSGTDTIPAWLSPGEFVMNAQATKNNIGLLQMMNAGHFDHGGLIGDPNLPVIMDYFQRNYWDAKNDKGGHWPLSEPPLGDQQVWDSDTGRPTQWGPGKGFSSWGDNGQDRGSIRHGDNSDRFPISGADKNGNGAWNYGMWLGPGTDATWQGHFAKGGVVGYYDTGTQQPVQSGTPVPKMPGGGAQQPKPMPKQGQQGGQPHLTGSVNPGPGNTNILGGSDVHPGVATPGADTQQFGEGLPASSGIGFGGGLIGGLEQAAAGAASAAGGAFGGGGGAAAGMALNAAFQMMNRTAGYIGQLGGIAAEGVLSTLLPADSPLSNFSNTLPGKLIAGIAGVRPGQPNSAGKTEAPLKTKGLEDQSRDGGGTQGGGQYAGGGDNIGSQTNFHGPITVKANNPQEFQQQMTREYSGARAAYPTNLP